MIIINIISSYHIFIIAFFNLLIVFYFTKNIGDSKGIWRLSLGHLRLP